MDIRDIRTNVAVPEQHPVVAPAPTTDVGPPDPAVGQGGFTPQVVPPAPQFRVTPSVPTPVRSKRALWLRLAIWAFIILGAIGGVFLVFRPGARSSLNSSNLSDPSSRINSQAINLSDISTNLNALQGVHTLTVNGQLKVGESLTLQPGTKPSDPALGQLYYDKATNQLGYYNGTGFAYLQGGGNTTNNVTNVTNAGPTTNVTLVTNNNTSNSTTTNVTTGASAAGTAGSLAMFTGGASIGNSILSQNNNQLYINGSQISAANLSDSSNLAKLNATQTFTGANTFNNTLSVLGTTSNSSADALTVSNSTSSQLLEIRNDGLVNIGAAAYVLGNSSIGVGQDNGINGIITADQFTTGNSTPTVTSMSVYVGNISQTNNQYQLAIYADNNGKPGSWIASSAVGTLKGNNTWNTLPITATLAPNTAYWLAYVTNSTSTSQNDPYYAPTGSPTHAYANFAFGSGSNSGLPATFPTPTTVNNFTHSIYATTSVVTAPAIAVTPSGAVGINNVSPQFPLDVGGAINSSTGIYTPVLDAATAGGTLNIGTTHTTSLTIGNSSGGSATTLQGGTGSVSIITAAANGTSGVIGIQTGASATTAAGNVNIDTGSSIITGVVVNTKTFESGIDNMGNCFGYSSTLTSSTAQAHSGTHSLAMTVNTAPNFCISDNAPFNTFPVTPGHNYALSAWVRAGTNPATITATYAWSVNGYYGGGLVGSGNWGSATDNSSGWTRITGTLTAPAGAAVLGFGFSSGNAVANSDIHYFDDVSLTDLSASSAIAAVNIGATNAQAVTVGNANQLNATSIYGNGLTIAGGTNGTVNLTGGTLNETAGNSNYTTTSGALNITSATSATWKIAAANGTGGNLTVQAGSAASGNNNGGNLVLQGGAANGTGTGGSVIIKPQTDSTAALQVQNSTGTALLTADTVNSVLTSSGNIIVNSPSACSYANFVTYVNGLTPASYWKLEDTGSTAADSSGNNNTGTLTNVTTNQTPGPFTCANTHPSMLFSGASNSKIITANHATSPGTYSQVAMFKTSNAGEFLMGYTDGGGNHDRELYIGNDGKLYARIFSTVGGDQIINSAGTVNDGNWHIAVVTVSGAGMYLYLDGNQVAGNASYTTPQTYTGFWELGDQINATSLTGNLAQVVVTNSALNALQVQTLAADSGFYNGNLASIGIGTTTPAANLHVAGTALVKSQTNSTTAFQVQTAAGSTVLNVDTTNGRLGIGTNAPTQKLEVSAGNAQIDYGHLTFVGVAAPTSAPTLAVSGSGILNATYYYLVTYVTANGETNNGTLSASVAPANQQVNLTNIPIGPAGVTARRIYRTKANPSWPYPTYLLTTINDNTSTTYTDNVPDGNLGGGPVNLNTVSYLSNSEGQSVSEAFGLNATVRSTNATAIGNGALSDYASVALGASALSGNAGSVAIGNGANVDWSGVSIGFSAASWDHSVVVGANATTNGSTGNYSVVLGESAQATSVNQFVVGSNSGAFIQDAYIGSGVADATPHSVTLHATGGSGANITGANLSLAGGISTGSANGGNINLQIAKPGSAGSASNTLSTVASLSGANGSALFKDATDSASAFQVQNAAGTTEFNVNTSTGAVQVNGLLDTTGNTNLAIGYANATSITIGNSGLNNLTSLYGSTLIKSAGANSATAFQVQNTSGTALLTADTSGMKITVQALVVSTTLTVNGHIISGGSTPGIAAGAAACTVPTVSVSGNDTSGIITVTTGSGCSGGGTLATLTFASAYAAAPHVTLTPGSSTAQTLGAYVNNGTILTTSVAIGTNNTPVNATTYQWNYLITQ